MSTLPTEMTVIAISAPGGPEVLIPERRPLESPTAGEILVKVAAAGVNRADVMQRQGLYPPPPGASDIPGLEFAGTVVGLGPGAGRFKIGDAVCALVAGGGYAEYALVHETNALRVPEPLSMVEAGAVPEAFFTVWHNLIERGRLKSGESVLIHGGSSGIGTTAIQFAKAFGAKVIITAGSATKCQRCIAIGADYAVNYHTEDFVAFAKSVTGGEGVDLILDMVGGDYIGRNYEAAAVEGRIVQIAIQGSPRANVDFRRLMIKRLTHTGSTLRSRPIADKAAMAHALERQIWPLIAAGKIKPVIDRTFPLKEAGAAQALMESSDHIGKIVLTV